MGAVLTLEFTIEPFVEGQPGPHVLEAVAAAGGRAHAARLVSLVHVRGLR